MGKMTPLETATAIAERLFTETMPFSSAVNLIHRALIEAANEEMERRRDAERRISRLEVHTVDGRTRLVWRDPNSGKVFETGMVLMEPCQ